MPVLDHFPRWPFGGWVFSTGPWRSPGTTWTSSSRTVHQRSCPVSNSHQIRWKGPIIDDYFVISTAHWNNAFELLCWTGACSSQTHLWPMWHPWITREGCRSTECSRQPVQRLIHLTTLSSEASPPLELYIGKAGWPVDFDFQGRLPSCDFRKALVKNGTEFLYSSTGGA